MALGRERPRRDQAGRNAGQVTSTSPPRNPRCCALIAPVTPGCRPDSRRAWSLVTCLRGYGHLPLWMFADLSVRIWFLPANARKGRSKTGEASGDAASRHKKKRHAAISQVPAPKPPWQIRLLRASERRHIEQCPLPFRETPARGDLHPHANEDCPRPVLGIGRIPNKRSPLTAVIRSTLGFLNCTWGWHSFLGVDG